MTKAQLIKKILKELWFYTLAYITNYLFPLVKEALKKSKENFLEFLWNRIKGDFKRHISNVIKEIEKSFNSESFEIKEKLVLEKLLERVKLPLILKPFKSLILKSLKNKINSFIRENLKNAKYKLNEIA